MSPCVSSAEALPDGTARIAKAMEKALIKKGSSLLSQLLFRK